MITVNVEAGVATIEMEDFSALSSHDLAAGRALADTIRGQADDDRVRAIVLSARGRDFCPAIESPRHYEASSGLYQMVCYSKKVIVVAVRGVCTGAGSALLLCADLAVMADDAVVESPFSAIPEANYVLASLTMRLSRAKAWVLTQEPMSADSARRCGLVNRVVEPGRVKAEALKMAQAAARIPLDATAISKMMLESYLDTQSVGREFDMATFHAAGMRSMIDPTRETAP